MQALTFKPVWMYVWDGDFIVKSKPFVFQFKIKALTVLFNNQYASTYTFKIKSWKKCCLEIK